MGLGIKDLLELSILIRENMLLTALPFAEGMDKRVTDDAVGVDSLEFAVEASEGFFKDFACAGSLTTEDVCGVFFLFLTSETRGCGRELPFN